MDLKNPASQKILLGLIVVLGLGYAFYRYMAKPKQAQIAVLTTEAQRLEAYNQTAKQAAQAGRIAALEEESVSYERRLEAFEELIPSTEHVPQLLERIATAALESDVDLLSFSPLPSEPGTFYTRQFYEVEVRGGYHELGSFLTRVGNLPRIIKPTISQLIGERVVPAAGRRTPAPNEPPPPETLVHAKLQLSTYVLPGGEPKVVAADTTARAQSATPLPGEATPVEPPPPAPAPAAPTESVPTPGAAAVPPPLEARLAPGVAPGIALEREPTTSPPGVTPPAAAADTIGPAAPAGAAAAPGEPTPPPPQPVIDPAPTEPAPSPATPADLTPPGGRATPADDRARPGALPPLDEND